MTMPQVPVLGQWTVLQDDGSMAASPLGPPKPPCCVGGWDSHEWKLAIEEGQVTLYVDCKLCHDGIDEWNAASDLGLFQMEPIPVQLKIEHDPGNPPYGIDPYVRVQLHPTGEDT